VTRRRDGSPGLLTSCSFVVLLLTGLLYFTASGVLSLALPLYVSDELHGSAFVVGLVIGAVTVTAIFLRPAAGRLTTAHGSKKVSLIGLLVVSASWCCYGLTESVPVLVLLRMATGVGQAAAYLGLARLAYDLAPPDRKAQATSYFSVALYGGFAVGPLLGDRLVTSAGYTVTWFLTGATGLLALAVGLFLKDPPPAPLPAEDPAPARRPRRTFQRDSIGPALVLLLSLSGYTAFATSIPLYVRSLLDVDAGIALAESAGIVLVVRMVGGRLPDLLGPVSSASISLTTQAAGWAVVAASPTAVGLYGGIGLMSLGVALLYPALFTFAMHRAPTTEHGSAVATVTMAVDAANGLGPLLLGAVVAASGSHRSAFVAAGLLNVVALVVVVIRTRAWRATAMPRRSPVPRVVPGAVQQR
jgi:MFS family permease